MHRSASLRAKTAAKCFFSIEDSDRAIQTCQPSGNDSSVMSRVRLPSILSVSAHRSMRHVRSLLTARILLDGDQVMPHSAAETQE